MAGLTREEIFAVADAVAAEGLRVRVAEVHRRLGTGSLTTVTNVIREWHKVNQPAAATEKAAVPQSVTDRLGSLGAELWAQAQAVANEELGKERQELETYRAEIEDQQQETAEYADSLYEMNEELKGKNLEQERQLNTLQTERDNLAGHLKETSEQLVAAETREQSSRQHIADLKEVLNERETEREEMSRTARQQAEEVSKLREELAVIKERQRVAEEQLAEERAGVKEMQAITAQRLEEERAAREQVLKNLEASRDREQAAEIKAAKLEGEVTALRAQATVITESKKPESSPKANNKQ